MITVFSIIATSLSINSLVIDKQYIFNEYAACASYQSETAFKYIKAGWELAHENKFTEEDTNQKVHRIVLDYGEEETFLDCRIHNTVY